MLYLHNTYTKRKECFKPLKDNLATIYTCGPTVYHYAHIGNFRSFIIADVLKKYLEYSGYQVKHVKNITDVGHLTQSDIEQGEDKIVAAAQKTGKTPKDIADYFARAFFNDEKKINIKKANFYPRATKYIKKMIKAIKILIKKNYAYENNGSVFYDITKFKNYGKLSGNTLKKLKGGARLKIHPLKKHWYDFALWLKAPQNHLLEWESPWSTGYPGWHLECSVMSMDTLGATIDIHTGAEDNIFPHHENEIAQSEGLTNKKFVRFWFHIRHLLIDGKKMSKSKGNFYTLKDIAQQGYSPLAFRLLVLNSHYKNKMNFTWQALQDAQNALNGLADTVNNLPIDKSIKTNKSNIDRFIKTKRKLFKKYMDDDLNTPRALSTLFDFISDIRNGKTRIKTRKDAKSTYKFIQELDAVLGLNLKKQKQIIPPKIKNLVREREELRREKRWEEADKIRKQIEKAGYILEDTAKKTTVKRKR